MPHAAIDLSQAMQEERKEITVTPLDIKWYNAHVMDDAQRVRGKTMIYQHVKRRFPTERLSAVEICSVYIDDAVCDQVHVVRDSLVIYKTTYREASKG